MAPLLQGRYKSHRGCTNAHLCAYNSHFYATGLATDNFKVRNFDNSDLAPVRDLAQKLRNDLYPNSPSSATSSANSERTFTPNAPSFAT